MATVDSIRRTRASRAGDLRPLEPEVRDPPWAAGLFSAKGMLIIWSVFIAAVVAAWGAAQGVRILCELSGITADVPLKWPLGVVRIKVPGIHSASIGLAVSAGILLIFLGLLRRTLPRITGNLFAVILLGFLLVLGTNLIHGPSYGLVHPHQAPLQYYHDAEKVTTAGEFLRGFEAAQAGLGCHARTHPPGAVLFFYGLTKLVGNSAAVSIAIAAVAVGLSGALLYRILLHDFDRKTSGYVTFLFLLIPAIQIYYCATLDAIVAGCCLGVLLSLRHSKAWLSVAGSIACLFGASFLTFGACFLVPVIVGFEIIVHRSVRRSIAVFSGVGILYVGIYLLTGFDYLGSLRTASALENPQGFLLFAEPVTYIMTRLENVGEIVVFLGPFLLLLFVLGMRAMLRTGAYPNLLVCTSLGVVTLSVMFLTGAFRTGETARACLFIYPYLLLPVAAYLHHAGFRDDEKGRLLCAVFAQSLVMQTFGGFSW